MIHFSLIALGVVAIIFGLFMIKKAPEPKVTDVYKKEHIDDFIAFAKTQSQLPKVKSIKAIRTEFTHLSLVHALEIYELANENNQNTNTQQGIKKL